jgi:hypothetical protein
MLPGAIWPGQIADALRGLIHAGPTGPALSLLLAMTGRAAGLDELSGDGARAKMRAYRRRRAAPQRS